MDSAVEYLNSIFAAAQKDPYYRYLQQVDWEEPWIVALLAFHLITLVSLVALRKYHIFILLVLSLSTLTVLNARQLNEYASRYWFTFSQRNYFDISGFFITVTVSLPLLVNCIVASGLLLWQAVALVLEVMKKKAASVDSKKKN
ncbi:hypothetical protein MP638_004972 [Amoeboaphelidium occidentale]|nr:hypothetical protein MP638_004972 [Amoeboaphelidium occidentale]